jgi:hydrogenase maturation factor
MHHYTYAQIKVKAHERLCNITRMHKLKQRNMGDYVTLHVDTNDSKATAYSNKE